MPMLGYKADRQHNNNKDETAILNTAKANILNLIKNKKQNKYLLIIFI